MECLVEAYGWIWSKSGTKQKYEANKERTALSRGDEMPSFIRREGVFKEPICQSKEQSPKLNTIKEGVQDIPLKVITSATFRVMVTTCGLKVMGKKDEADWEAPLLKSPQRVAIMSTKARFHQPEVDAMLAQIKETRRPTQEEVDRAHCRVKELSLIHI